MLSGVTHNLDHVARDLTELERKELPFATALALTRTAQATEKNLVTEMQRVFDRPTPFTLKGLYVKPATKADLTAAVFFRTFAPKGTPAGKYLQAQIFGGMRAQKRSELAFAKAGLMGNLGYFVPSRHIKLDQYGNVPGSTIKAMLSDVGAGSAEQTMRKATKGRSKRRRNVTYFVPPPGSALHDAAPGVWARRGREVVPALIFVSSTSYRVRFPFHALAARFAAQHWPREFEAAWTRALSTSRHR